MARIRQLSNTGTDLPFPIHLFIKPSKLSGSKTAISFQQQTENGQQPRKMSYYECSEDFKTFEEVIP